MSAADAAKSVECDDTWPEPDMRLIGDGRVPPPALEDDALPAGWGAWITAEATARACPRDYVAAGLIAAASAWIGNARRIAATADWIEPPHLWFALIGPPSTGKTPALRPMKDVSRKLERDTELKWRDALASYERDAEAASAADKIWRERPRRKTARRPIGRKRPKHQKNRRAHVSLQWTPQRKNCNSCLPTMCAACCICVMSSRDGSAASIATAAKVLIAGFIWSAGTVTTMFLIV